MIAYEELTKEVQQMLEELDKAPDYDKSDKQLLDEVIYRILRQLKQKGYDRPFKSFCGFLWTSGQIFYTAKTTYFLRLRLYEDFGLIEDYEDKDSPTRKFSIKELKKRKFIRGDK